MIFANAEGEAIEREGNSNDINIGSIQHDCCFEGGDVLRTDESIINGGDIPSIYQSARFGTDLYYKLNELVSWRIFG